MSYAKLTNPVTINCSQVEFVDEAEHVGVVRSTRCGNMPHIIQRISSHKKVLASICSAGMSKGHRGNPAASLRVHTLHATPVLLSGVASLVLTKKEISVLDTHYKNTVQRLQRLHPKTPRAAVFFLAGCLPFEALLHSRQLGLFSMICHLPADPLHAHARYVLTAVPSKAKSWFQQIEKICDKYGLPSPLQLLSYPLSKGVFKSIVKRKIVEYWHELLRAEAESMRSMMYFKSELYSLTRCHYMWSSAASNPYECSKSTVLARMISGRFRTEALCRHWSTNRSGYCRAPTCNQVYGTLEHLLVSCPALVSVRERMYTMWLERTVMFPSLHATIRDILVSDENQKVQFILEPLAFPEIFKSFKIHGNRFLGQLSYLTRTFAFYIDKEYRNIVKLGDLNPPMQLDNHPDHSNLNLVAVPCDASPVVPTNNTCPARSANHQAHQSDVQSNEAYYVVQGSDCARNQVATVPDMYRTISASPCLIYNAAQASQYSYLANKPGIVGPSCVGPVTTAPTSTVRHGKFCPSSDLSHPDSGMASVTSVSGVTSVVCTWQQVVPSTNYQYQDCTVGFCGGWDSHDHIIQVSSQSHIQNHPSSMHGTL